MKFTPLRIALLTGAFALVPITTAAIAGNEENDEYAAIEEFVNAYQKVKANYVDKVDDKTLIKGAIDGMLSNLDPHSNYEDARDLTSLRKIGRAHV